MNILVALAFGTNLLLVNRLALAQNGNMMYGNGGMWGGGWMGGYGGIWGPLVLLILVVGLVVWLVKRNGK